MGFEPQHRNGAFTPSRRALFGWMAGGAALAVTAQPVRAFWQQPTYPGLTGLVNDYVTSRRLPGAIVAVGRGAAAADLIAAGTVAFDSRQAVDGDTLWRLYSQTKPVTGIATMMLVEDGRLQLDQPLADILPAFANVRVLARPDAPLEETVALATPITIRHLLTHTAGLGYGLGRGNAVDRAWQERGLTPGQVSKLPLPGFPPGRTLGPIDVWADAVAQVPLIGQPGTAWRYSASIDLLGRVIEVASGKSFATFLEERLFGPLGMTSTSFQVAAANVARFATNYAPFGGSLIPIDPAAASIYLDPPSFAFGGAGLVSSANDYDRFLAMLIGEGALGTTRVMSAETARLAMSNLLPEGADVSGTFVAGNGFGAGGRVSLPSSTGGEGLFGWGGAAGTMGFVHRRLGLRCGGYANYMPAEAYDFQRRIGELAIADVMAASAPAA